MGPENLCIVLLDLIRIQDPQWSLPGPFFRDMLVSSNFGGKK